MFFRGYSGGQCDVVSYLAKSESRLISHAGSSVTVIPMSVPTTSVPSPPRSARPIAARKQQNDPVWSSTNPSSVTSAKRQAVERVEGEPRNKRKRVEPTLQPFSQQLGHRADKLQERQIDVSPVVSCVVCLCTTIRRYPAQSRSVNKGD
jgi:hypothetical protein